MQRNIAVIFIGSIKIQKHRKHITDSEHLHPPSFSHSCVDTLLFGYVSLSRPIMSSATILGSSQQSSRNAHCLITKQSCRIYSHHNTIRFPMKMPEASSIMLVSSLNRRCISFYRTHPSLQASQYTYPRPYQAKHKCQRHQQ